MIFNVAHSGSPLKTRALPGFQLRNCSRPKAGETWEEGWRAVKRASREIGRGDSYFFLRTSWVWYLGAWGQTNSIKLRKREVQRLLPSTSYPNFSPGFVHMTCRVCSVQNHVLHPTRIWKPPKMAKVLYLIEVHSAAQKWQVTYSRVRALSGK